MALLRIRTPELHHRRAARPAHRTADTNAVTAGCDGTAAAGINHAVGGGVEVGGEIGGEVVVEGEGVHAAVVGAIGGPRAREREEVLMVV